MTVVRLLLWLLPPSPVKNMLLRRIGVTLGHGVRIGPTVVLGDVRFTLGDNTSLGTLNVFRSLRLVHLDADAYIGNFNQFTAAPDHRAVDPELGLLRLGRGAGFTNRHHVDCSGRFLVGDMSMIAGIRSVFQTHELDLAQNVARAGDIVVGARCFTATGVQMLQNSYLPDRSILAAGSTRTATAPGDPTRQLYAGTPAQPKKDISGWAWFDRIAVHTPVDLPTTETLR
ncbi:acyltransferase [Williamsia sp. SKLECPSW1]